MYKEKLTNYLLSKGSVINYKNILSSNFIKYRSYNIKFYEYFYSNCFNYFKFLKYRNTSHINMLNMLYCKTLNKFKINLTKAAVKHYNYKITILLENVIKICSLLKKNFVVKIGNCKNYIYRVVRDNCVFIEKYNIAETNKNKSYITNINLNINNKEIKTLKNNRLEIDDYNKFGKSLQELKIKYNRPNISPTNNKKLLTLEVVLNNIKNSNKNECASNRPAEFYKSTKNLIFGQDLNVVKISNKLLKLDNNKTNRPVACVLLCGPSGTGKTEISKILSKHVDKKSHNLIHLDMSEYMESHSVSRLIGSPPGYIGSKESSAIIRDITANPKSIVLFDEIEKANKSIYSVFLQILDEGVLTDSRGVKGDFKKSLVIFTSNIGSDTFKHVNKYKTADIEHENKIKKAVNEHFKPEFINRLDDVLIFNPLSVFSLYSVFNKYTKDSDNIILDNSLKSLISLISYSPVKGSRFLLNNIDKIIFNTDYDENAIISHNQLLKCRII